MLVKAWLTWRDRDAALLIVEQFESAFLVKHFEKLASDLECWGRHTKTFPSESRASGHQH